MYTFSKALLDLKGTTAYAVAKWTKISPSNIYKYRDGTLCPTLPVARKIAKVLLIELDNLRFKKESL